MQDRFKFRAAVNVFGKIKFAYSDYKNDNPEVGDLRLFLKDNEWIVEEYEWVEYEEDDRLEWTTLYQTEPIKVEQCTGLKDKNGKFIYENDIIQKENHKFIVKYDFDSFKAYDKENCPISIYGLFTFKICNSGWPEEENENTIEVIGNIHENSERIPKCELYKY